MTQNIGSKAKQGLIWSGVFNIFQSIIRVGGSIALARLLFPEDFGLYGIAMLVVQFARRLVQFGFNLALIQRKEIKPEHYDTVFLTNLMLMSSLTTIVVVASPYIADFFNNEKVQPIVAVISFEFILRSVSIVNFSILKRELKFKQIEFIKSVAFLSEMVLSIIFAIAGFGVWSLVIGVLGGSVIANIGGFYYNRWYPTFKFRFWAFKDLFMFGIWIFVNNFMSYFINQSAFFFIGKFLGAAQLGYYERAFRLMSAPRKKITRKINSVLFATYSRMQDEKTKVVKALLRTVTSISIIVYPLMIWLFFASPSLITVLYGSRWTLTIIPLQTMCIGGLLHTFTMIFNPLFTAVGLIGNRARRQFIYLIILVSSILLGIQWGINGVAWAIAGASLIQLTIMLHLAVTRLPFTVWIFIKAQKSSIIYGLIQISSLVLLDYISEPYFTKESLSMLISVTVFSLISFFGSHFVIRYKDIDGIIFEMMSELKKITKKIPVLKRFGFISSKL